MFAGYNLPELSKLTLRLFVVVFVVVVDVVPMEVRDVQNSSRVEDG